MNDKEAMNVASQCRATASADLCKNILVDGGSGFLFELLLDAAKAIETLAQPEQEPVAWGVFEGNLHDMFFTLEEAQEMALLKGSHAEVRPLYTHPPQRTWVGLTLTQVKLLGEGVQEEAIKSGHSRDWVFYTHINEALKEKNT